MKLKALTLNNLKKEEIINTKINIRNKKHKNTFRLFSNNEHNAHNIHNHKKNENNKNIFKNYTLLKSLSIKTNTELITPKNDCHIYTLVPNIKTFKTNYSYNKRPKKIIKLLNTFNDEKFFCTSKDKKKFSFPKENIIIKKSRINHDINYFNFKHAFADYSKEYEKNSYKIQKMIKQDNFINKIKKDLLRMKYSNQIKLIEDLK